MKKLFAIISVVLALLLAGCDPGPAQEPDDSKEVVPDPEPKPEPTPEPEPEPEPDPDPILEQEEYGCYFGVMMRHYNRGSDQMVVHHTEDGLVFVLMNPADKEQVTFTVGGDTFEVGYEVQLALDWRRDKDDVYTNTYRLSVAKADGHKVWLGDGKGNGVIIRK